MMKSEAVRDLAVEALEDLKAVNIAVLNVSKLTGVTDYMIVASGTSSRHVRSLVDAVVVKAKERGVSPLGVEGEQHAQWGLVDLGDVVVHIMLPEVRDFYQLEKLWSFDVQEKRV
jgi:ribosome-associated protein